MRSCSRFQFTFICQFTLLTALLLLALPGLTFASKNKPPKTDKKARSAAETSPVSKTDAPAAKNLSAPTNGKESNNAKTNGKTKAKGEAYPSNCSPDEPDCANKLNPETAPISETQTFSNYDSPPKTESETSESYWESFLKAIGWSSSEPELVSTFQSGPAAECPDGYKSLGGNFNSDPTVNTFKDKVFIFARGVDNALYYQVLEKGKKNNWVSLGGNTISNPASYFNDNGLFLEVIGADGQKYHRKTIDGITFTDWTLGTVNARTTNSKTGIRGSLLTFVKGKGENPPLCYQVKKGSKTEKKDKKPNNGNGNKNGNGNANGNNGNGNGNNQTGTGGDISLYSSPEWGDCWWDPWCEPPPPPTDQYSPVGYFDSIDVSGNNGFISGWSYDPDHPEWSNDVHIYFDGPAGSGTGYAATAGNPRQDVNAAFGIPGDHGFYFQIPAQYLDGQQHVVYVYGIDTGPNPNSSLNGNPKYFTINPPPPAAPTWGTVNTISQTQLDVYWNGVTNATGYNVKMDGNQTHNNIPWTSIPVYNLAPGSTHTFEVQAVNQWGVSGWSETRSATTLPPVMPATPTWGTVNTMSQTQLDVYWNQAANATGYNVKMDGNQTHNNIPWTSIPVYNLAPGSTHTFEVQAVNQIGVSGWSSPRSGTTQPIPIPSITSVSPQTDPTCLNLVINPSAGAVSYNVRITNSGYTINVTQTSFPWCGLTANTYFEFQVQAVTSLGTSGWSSPTGGTTGASPTPTPTPTGTLKLSKEYIYSGSRQLATEDYGIAQPNPTPTP